MVKTSKVSELNPGHEDSSEHIIENNLQSYEDKQMEINTRRDEFSLALVTDSYEKLSFKHLWRPIGSHASTIEQSQSRQEF